MDCARVHKMISSWQMSSITAPNPSSSKDALVMRVADAIRKVIAQWGAVVGHATSFAVHHGSLCFESGYISRRYG